MPVEISVRTSRVEAKSDLRLYRRTFICARTSINCVGFIVANVWLITSKDVIPMGNGAPAGNDLRNASLSLSGPPPPPPRGPYPRSPPRASSLSLHCARVSPPSSNSPRTVVLPSRNGSESARSIRRGLPPTSTLLRFRTADWAVSWSIYTYVLNSSSQRR